MDSSQLQAWQARKINETLRPMLDYLARLKGRMEQTQFPQHDKLYSKTVVVYENLQSLINETRQLAKGKTVRQIDGPSWQQRMSGPSGDKR